MLAEENTSSLPKQGPHGSRKLFKKESQKWKTKSKSKSMGKSKSLRSTRMKGKTRKTYQIFQTSSDGSPETLNYALLYNK